VLKNSIFSLGTGILEAMDVQSMELFASLLAVVAAAGVVVVFVARVAAPRLTVARQLADGLHGSALWLAWIVAAVATAGSLYFSEVADYVPCRLCWFQRICMYPLAGILLVAALRKDRGVRWYALPLAVAGLGVSTYHYVIEWKPSLGEGACAVGPSCTDIWFRELGFVTLAFMALAGFAVILALLFVTPRPVTDGK
jgi:disulfide bond formation protein DsbB